MGLGGKRFSSTFAAWGGLFFGFRFLEASKGFGDELLEKVEVVEVVDAEHVALRTGVGENLGEAKMSVGRGDFDEKVTVANVGKIGAVEIDEILTHHRADGDVAERLETGDDLIFLGWGGGHVGLLEFLIY